MKTTLTTRLAASIIAVAAVGAAQPVMADALSAKFGFSIVESGADGEEILVERDNVRPGETIHYALAHENVSEDELSDLVFSGPIPEGVTLDIGTQTSSLAALFEVQAELEPEVEGLEWSTWPAERKVIEADGSEYVEPLPAAAVAAVRWTLEQSLPAGATALNSYRVVVN